MDATTTVRLHTGRRMPILGLGTWMLTHDTAGSVAEALRLGYRMIDTSGDYGTQPGIADALRRVHPERDAVYVVTKVEEDEDAHASARRNVHELGLEWADLILIHRPPEEGVGEALWEGLVRARGEGLTRDIGVSNYSIDQLERLMKATGEAPAVNQIEWTPFGWSRDMLAFCNEHGIVIQGYSPLTRAERLDDPHLVELARRCSATPAQLLLRWALEQGVVPLPKANRREHQVENLGAFRIELDEDVRRSLDRLNEPWSSLGAAPQYLEEQPFA